MGAVKIILIVLGVLFLLFVGCTMLISTGIEEVSKEMENTEKELEEKYEKVDKGMTKTQVKNVIGEPDNKQNMEAEGFELECWYYKYSLQICFNENGKVQSKANY